MGDWKADEYVRMDAADKFSGAGGDSDVYLWIVPARIAGAWRVQLPVSGKLQTYEVTFEQQYQQISGAAQVNGRAVKIEIAKLRGDELTFSFVAEVNGATVKQRDDGAGLTFRQPHCGPCGVDG